MPKFELVFLREGAPNERFAVPLRGLTIGRNAENDVTLGDQLVSRRHARVLLADSKLTVQDLDSRNGIEVNGQAVHQGPLKHGDQLTVGESTFEIVETPDSEFGHTVITPEHAASLYKSMLNDTGSRRMPVLYEAAQLMGTVFDLDTLLKEILILIFRSIPVQRGFVILTLSQNVNELNIHTSHSTEPDDQGPPLSHTLLQHVFDRKESMLTMDAQHDSRFDSTASIMGHGIHSAMCAPLMGRDLVVVGAIYVDAGTSHRPFEREELELLTAITRVVGVAVENARLYRENVERERLAAIGEAVAGLGHCVKNILTGIRGGGEFINMAIEQQDLKYVKMGWPTLSRSIDRIEMLVMNMLSFSKDRQPQRMLTDMTAVMREVLETQRSRAERYNITLEFDQPEPVRADVDQREIYRVLLNLLVNAMEACEQTGGVIRLSCASDSEGCTVRIQDTGCGIPPEILPRLSRAFVSSKGSSGTGLGLACSYKIVREHGGEIEVESEVGKGTTFTIFLPNQEAAARKTIRLE